jgi:hypothetical protein
MKFGRTDKTIPRLTNLILSGQLSYVRAVIVPTSLILCIEVDEIKYDYKTKSDHDYWYNRLQSNSTWMSGRLFCGEKTTVSHSSYSVMIDLHS